MQISDSCIKQGEKIKMSPRPITLFDISTFDSVWWACVLHQLQEFKAFGKKRRNYDCIKKSCVYNPSITNVIYELKIWLKLFSIYSVPRVLLLGMLWRTSSNNCNALWKWTWKKYQYLIMVCYIYFIIVNLMYINQQNELKNKEHHK